MTMQWRVILAWAVHLYTALGVPLGVWAIFAIFQNDYRTAWLLIAVTVFLDATDGVLARKVRVREVLPSIDGALLDNIVDYFCWVIVPIILLVQTGLLPMWAAVAPLVASGYGFSQVQAKTEGDDAAFVGFPSYWSMGAYYLYLFDTSVPFNTALVLLFSVLVFVPIRYPYPTKTRSFRPLTLGLGAIWGAIMLGLAVQLTESPRWLLWGSLIFPFYYLFLTIWLWWRRRTTAKDQTIRPR
jgi:phosphatidylcholine synthase